MNPFLTLTAAFLGFAGDPTSTLQRERHEDTIYIVRGTADQLSRFQNDVGSRWAGGKLLTKDDAKGLYRYWAYPNRTAPQAREFMFGALMSGLMLDMIAYDERLPFRAERSALDEVAIGCGLTRDPFFITPDGELQVGFGPAEKPAAVTCVKEKLGRTTLPNVKMRPTI